MKKDAFLIGFFLGSGIVLGEKLGEKIVEYTPKCVNYVKGKFSNSDKKSGNSQETTEK